MDSADQVYDWLFDIDEGEADELSQWLYVCEQQPEALDIKEFQQWWERLERAAGGHLPRSIEIDVRSMFGDLTEDSDLALLDNEDAPDTYGVKFRDALSSLGLAPSGVWQTTLLGDRVDNAVVNFHSWVGFDAAAVRETFEHDLREVRDQCIKLIEASSSIGVRREAQAISAVCALHTSDPSTTLRHVESFFELDQQTHRESGREASHRELHYVASAGTAAHALLGDAEGVQETMRRIRLRAEPAGEMLPASLVTVWARAIAKLDPEFAQILARNLLVDLHTEGEIRNDAAFAAAHLLLEVSARAYDLETVGALVGEWMPAALEAPHGPGVQAWLAILETDDALDDIDE